MHIETDQLTLAFQQMQKVLKPDGLILMSIRDGIGKMNDRSLATIDGQEFDRNFIAHNLEELQESANGILQYQCELESDMEVWKNYVFKMM